MTKDRDPSIGNFENYQFPVIKNMRKPTLTVDEIISGKRRAWWKRAWDRVRYFVRRRR